MSAGRIATVTSYTVSTARAVVDVNGTALSNVLNVTSEELFSGWTVWIEQRGGSLNSDWVITGIYSPISRFQSNTADVTTTGTTTSTTYVATLTTGGAGPTITGLWMVAGHQYLIIVSASIDNSLGAGHASVMTPVVSGASTLAAADVNAATTQSATPAIIERSTLWTPTTTGLHDITCNYKIVNASTGTFSNRRLTVKA